MELSPALLGPVLIIQLGLAVLALRDLVPRPVEMVTGENKLIWGLVVVLFGILGPLAYFVFGRREA